jgi:hypothetical protein
MTAAPAQLSGTAATAACVSADTARLSPDPDNAAPTMRCDQKGAGWGALAIHSAASASSGALMIHCSRGIEADRSRPLAGSAIVAARPSSVTSAEARIRAAS